MDVPAVTECGSHQEEAHHRCLWLKNNSIILISNPHVVPTYGGLMGVTYGVWGESM